MRAILAILLVVVLMCGTAPAFALPPTGDSLQMVVMVSRHGLRSPLVPNAVLDRYAAQPWPSWPVAPGVLTRQGAQQLELLGRYDGDWLRSLHLLPYGCAGAASAYLWTDTDQRTRASGQALAAGLFPGCAPAIHSLPAGTHDPLFSLTNRPVPAAMAAEAVAQVRQCAQPGPVLTQRMHALQRLLDGCGLQGACSPGARPALSMTDAPAWVRPLPVTQGLVDWQGPLPLASSFAEDFELEWLQNLPAGQVAWGRISPDALNQLIALHTRYIACLDHTGVLSRLGASDLLAHLVATLAQGGSSTPVPGAIGHPGQRLVVLVGHDSNLVGLSALLGLHWRLDGRSDDTPPASALLFELWKRADGQQYVRVEVQMPSLLQMRSLTPLTLQHPPLLQTAAVATCSADGCAWTRFRAVATSALDARYVVPLR